MQLGKILMGGSGNQRDALTQREGSINLVYLDMTGLVSMLERTLQSRQTLLFKPVDKTMSPAGVPREKMANHSNQDIKSMKESIESRLQPSLN